MLCQNVAIFEGPIVIFKQATVGCPVVVFKCMDIRSAFSRLISPGDSCEGGLQEAQGLQRP